MYVTRSHYLAIKQRINLLRSITVHKKLLDSIVSITGQRDIESLEYMLVATIAEHFPVTSIVLYKTVDENEFNEIEMTLQWEAGNTAASSSWNKVPELILAPALLTETLSNSNSQEAIEINGDGEYYIPISGQTRKPACLCIKSSNLEPSQLEVLLSLTKIYENYLIVLQENERDNLTSLLNRRTLEQRFGKLLSAQKRCQKVVANEFSSGNKRSLQRTDQIHLAMIDIDHFKKINDTYGHIYGDEILILIANLMRSTFRNTDLLFRFGGEEFVVLLEPIPTEMACFAMERFRRIIEEYKFPLADKVTVSIGLTSVCEESLHTPSIGRADQALYYAKNNGRNCVHCFEHLIENGLLSPSPKTGSVEIFSR